MAADVLRFAVEQAVLAPSSHNSQPWTFRVDEDSVDLFADPSRKLSAADPEGRELVISCGAALVNLELALAHKGRKADVAFLPDSEEPARCPGCGRTSDGSSVTSVSHSSCCASGTRRRQVLPFGGRSPKS